MDVLQQILEARNKYKRIGPKFQESLERRANWEPSAPPSATLDAPPVHEEQQVRPGLSDTRPPAAIAQGTDIQRQIQENLRNSRQIQQQQRTQQRQDELRSMMTRTRERSNNQLDPLSAGSNNGIELPSRNDDHGHGEVTGENGRLDTSQLVDADGRGNLLQPNAAAAWQQMVAAAAADGVNLTIGNSYRTYDRQVSLAEEKGLYSQGGLAATPGTSNHGWGTAVDVGEGAQRDWLAQNGNRFGFHTIPREPWHWEYRD